MIAPAIQLRIGKGFSLVELMVAMVISLLTIIAIFEVFATFEGQKRTTTSTMDVQESGLMALHAIERDARMAGLGMVVNDSMACPALTTYTDGLVETLPFLPVAITDGGATGGSDSVRIMYSTSSFAPTPSPLTLDLVTSAEQPVVSNTSGSAVFQVGDYIIVAQPSMGTTCARLRVTGTVVLGADVQIEHATDPANPPSATNIFAASGYTADSADPSLVINMGAMVSSTYSVVDGNLVFTDNTNGGGWIPLAAGVVNIQAQYGIAAAGSPTVQQWVNATGPWAAPIAVAAVSQIKAIRLAVIVRSPIAEREDVTNVCVNNAPPDGQNFGPCAWSDTAAFPAPLIDFRTDPQWQRHRYRVYETIIPLRNVIWGNI